VRGVERPNERVLYFTPTSLTHLHSDLQSPHQWTRANTHQFESFVPVWAYDEPKQKKKKVKSSKKSSKSEKSSGGGEGEGEAESQGQTSATEPHTSQAGLSHRQGATVEEIDDDDA
jgi:hypothetical protein